MLFARLASCLLNGDREKRQKVWLAHNNLNLFNINLVDFLHFLQTVIQILPKV